MSSKIFYPMMKINLPRAAALKHPVHVALLLQFPRYEAHGLGKKRLKVKRWLD